MPGASLEWDACPSRSKKSDFTLETEVKGKKRQMITWKSKCACAWITCLVRVAFERFVVVVPSPLFGRRGRLPVINALPVGQSAIKWAPREEEWRSVHRGR